MNCIARGTSTLSGRQAYMIPYGLFYVVPTFIISTIWFIPEVRIPIFIGIHNNSQERSENLTHRLVSEMARTQGSKGRCTRVFAATTSRKIHRGTNRTRVPGYRGGR